MDDAFLFHIDVHPIREKSPTTITTTQCQLARPLGRFNSGSQLRASAQTVGGPAVFYHQCHLADQAGIWSGFDSLAGH